MWEKNVLFSFFYVKKSKQEVKSMIVTQEDLKRLEEERKEEFPEEEIIISRKKLEEMEDYIVQNLVDEMVRTVLTGMRTMSNLERLDWDINQSSIVNLAKKFIEERKSYSKQELNLEVQNFLSDIYKRTLKRDRQLLERV